MQHLECSIFINIIIKLENEPLVTIYIKVI